MALDFEHIDPWTDSSGLGDTGFSARLKLRRNFEKIAAWAAGLDSTLEEKMHDLMATKVGHIAYTGTRIDFYASPEDADNGVQPLGGFDLSGRIYSIQLKASEPGTFFVLTGETSHMLNVNVSTLTGVIGGAMEDYTEDYQWTLYADTTSQGQLRAVKSGTLRAGDDIAEDIRPYVTVGDNRLRLLVEGTESRQSQALLFNVVVTALSLRAEPEWWLPWTPGQSWTLGGLFIGGNLEKKLHVRIDEREDLTYEHTYSSSQQYTTAPTSFVLGPDMNPGLGQGGVHRLDLWLSGGGIDTPRLTFFVMCPASPYENLVCLNAVAGQAVNYTDAQLFSYATYGTDSATFIIKATDGQTVFDVAEDRLSATMNTRHDYVKKLEIDTELTEGLLLNITATADGGNTVEMAMGIDNSNAFPAASGADVYINSAARSNAQADRQRLTNQAQAPAVASYEGMWKGVSFLNDAWAADPDGVRCLAVMAGSRLEVPTLTPLLGAETGSLTLEMRVRVSAPSDYDAPALTMMSTADYDPSQTSGLMLFPTRVTLLTTTERSVIPQTVQLGEDRCVHLVFVMQRGYSGTTGNLCQVYVNGIPNAMFQYSGSAGFGRGPLVVGSPTADVYLYSLRVYEGRALQPSEVLQNWLNSLGQSVDYVREDVRTANQITDNGEVSYDLCVARGLNRMIIELENEDADHLPHYGDGKKYTAMSALEVEYADEPDWNFRMAHTPVSGQGTTSMQYYRWNFRWKNGSDTVWTYANGTWETGKSGYIAGRGLHPKCNKVTAKKNYASSPQGHKMGATALYNDLMERLSLTSQLPDGARTAVYQYPVMGFLRHADGQMEFIGLYTIGPDKGDKDTFGYDTKRYPSMLSLEGPNHAPLATRFLHPWVEGDVSYNPDEETLEFGGEEGWDVDVCAYETDDPSDREAIQQLLEQEWRPAYDIACFCSPFLRSLNEIPGIDASASDDDIIAALNADPVAFRSQSTLADGLNNEVFHFYDSAYRLVYYRNATARYERLESHVLTSYLSSYLTTSSPTTEQLLRARAAKFRAEAQDYWDIGGSTYHDCFLELTGGSDNHGKNSYPFKLTTLAEGGRWSWRQDDLDTILSTDNNGQLTKGYSIEIGDRTANGGEIFQGDSSAFWRLVGSVFAEEKRDMMRRIFSALQAMASERNLPASTLQEAALSVFDAYFWSRAASYFPATAYAWDAVWSYVEPWRINPAQSYNGVYPLTQALGDQLQAERRWVELRLIYLLSLYRLGGFQGDDSGGLGALQFTTIEAHRFALVPAIDLYPSASLGGSTLSGTRTRAGETCDDLVTGTSDNTTFYLKAADWYTSLGDLSGLKLSSRGGSDALAIPFSVTGKRLREVKVGDADASKVAFNAGLLTIEGPAIETVDARNVTTLVAEVSLASCPRLRRALFGGSTARGLVLPVGARITEVSFPQTAPTVLLHSLPLLTDEGLTLPDEALPTISSLFFQNCARLSPLAVLRRIWQLPAEQRSLAYVTLAWQQPADAVPADLDMLATLANGSYGRVTYQDGAALNQRGLPDLQGSLSVSGSVYEDVVTTLEASFTGLSISVLGQVYMRFADAAAEALCARLWGDGSGLTRREAEAVASLTTQFKQQTAVTSFTELAAFTALTAPAASAFNNCTALKAVDLGSVTTLNYRLFEGCSALETLGDLSHIDTISTGVFYGCNNLRPLIFLPAWTTSIVSRSYDYSPFAQSSLRYGYFPRLLRSATDVPSGNYGNRLVGTFAVSIQQTIQNTVSLIFNILYLRDVSQIDGGSFQGATVSHLVVNRMEPPEAAGTHFDSLNEWTSTKYDVTLSPWYRVRSLGEVLVPSAAVEVYKAAPGWSEVADKIKPFESSPLYIGRVATIAEWEALPEGSRDVLITECM